MIGTNNNHRPRCAVGRLSLLSEFCRIWTKVGFYVNKIHTRTAVVAICSSTTTCHRSPNPWTQTLNPKPWGTNDQTQVQVRSSPCVHKRLQKRASGSCSCRWPTLWAVVFITQLLSITPLLHRLNWKPRAVGAWCQWASNGWTCPINR